ncbi:MAG: hypothetical protein KAQ83_00500 [Nanoarchaeota archaeon]|nr:hypothetical protein [Nanoarchaeota archaeon]
MEYYYKFYQPFISLEGYEGVSDKVNELFECVKDRIKRNITMYIVNLIVNSEHQIVVSSDTKWFANKVGKSWHSYRSAMQAQRLLLGKGLIIRHPGYKNVGYATGCAGRLEATPSFIQLFGDIPKQPIRVNTIDCPDMIFRSFGRHGRATRYKVKSLNDTTLIYEAIGDKKLTESVQLVEGLNSIQLKMFEMHKLNNEYFSRITLSFNTEIDENIAQNVYLTRIFTRMISGRYAQQHAYSYLNMKKENRKHLLINGERTVESDYSGMHINLLYAKEHLGPYEGDSYMDIVTNLVGSEDVDLRGAIKECILTAINAKDMINYKKSINWNSKKTKQILIQNSLTSEEVIDAFKIVHRPIAEYLNSSIGGPLMYQDSQILTQVLLKLKSEDILGLPLHDSIICQENDKERVKQIMGEIYLEQTGYPIDIKIKE